MLANVAVAFHPSLILNRGLVRTHAIALLLGNQEFARDQRELEPDPVLCHTEACFRGHLLWCPQCEERYCTGHMVPTGERCVFCEEQGRL